MRHFLFDLLFKYSREEPEVEKFEIKKGNYKTTIYMTFSKDGVPMYCNYESEYVPSENEVKLNELHLDLKKAIAKEDYLKAADLKKQIDKLKPTV